MKQEIHLYAEKLPGSDSNQCQPTSYAYVRGGMHLYAVKVPRGDSNQCQAGTLVEGDMQLYVVITDWGGDGSN